MTPRINTSMTTCPQIPGNVKSASSVTAPMLDPQRIEIASALSELAQEIARWEARQSFRDVRLVNALLADVWSQWELDLRGHESARAIMRNFLDRIAERSRCVPIQQRVKNVTALLGGCQGANLSGRSAA